MYTGELATRILAFVDNIDPTTASNRARRRRVVADIQEKYDEVWNHRGWRWSVGSASIVVPQGSRIGVLPSDFGIIPKYGGLYIDGQRMHDLSDATMNDIHQGVITASDVGFTLSGFSDADQAGTLLLDTPGPLTATIFYKKRPPLLADRPWTGYPSLAVGAAGVVTTGTHRLKATYITSDGFEHEAGDAISLAVTAQQITATLPDPGPVGEHNVVSVNLYMTIAAGVTNYYKVYNSVNLDVGSLVYSVNVSDANLVLLPLLVNQSTLSRIPPKYHYTVLLPGVRAMRKQSQGDTRDFEKEYRMGLAEMVREERPFQSEVQQLPRWSQYKQW